MTRPTTRASLVPIHKVGTRLVLKCDHCGGKDFYRGPLGYRHGKMVVATVYVSEDIPLPRGNEPNLRESAPPVFEGGVWAKRLRLHCACYDAMGQPFGPAVDRSDEEYEARKQRRASKPAKPKSSEARRREITAPPDLPIHDILERLEGRSA